MKRVILSALILVACGKNNSPTANSKLDPACVTDFGSQGMVVIGDTVSIQNSQNCAWSWADELAKASAMNLTDDSAPDIDAFTLMNNLNVSVNQNDYVYWVLGREDAILHGNDAGYIDQFKSSITPVVDSINLHAGRIYLITPYPDPSVPYLDLYAQAIRDEYAKIQGDPNTYAPNLYLIDWYQNATDTTPLGLSLLF